MSQAIRAAAMLPRALAALLLVFLAYLALSGDGSPRDACRESVHRDPVTGRAALVRGMDEARRASCRDRATNRS